MNFNFRQETMDKIWHFQTSCVFLIILQNTIMVVGRNEIEICQQGNQTIQHQLHIKSPNFPYAWSSHIKCQCDIEGDNIVIATRTLILTGHSSNSVLEISYNENGSQTLWPQDGMHTMFDQQNRKLVIAKMASKIKVSVNTPTEGSSENMFSMFMFDFQASSDMIVSCKNLSSSNQTTDDDNMGSSNKTDADITNNDFLEEIGSVCSPHFVIILGSLCCSLLLIILIISVILCCIVPRRRKDYTIDYRNQQVTDKTKMRKAAKTGRESIIYDEAKINLRPSAAYNNTTYTNSQQGDVSYTNTDSFSAAENRSALQRSYTMPPPACVRQSAQYVNTMSSEQDFR